MQTKEQVFKQCYNDLPKTSNDGNWIAFDELDNEVTNIVYSAMELYASQQQGGMRWVKASERLPNDDRTLPLKIYGVHYTGLFINSGESCRGFRAGGNVGIAKMNFPEVEWLDESEASPTSQPAQGEGDKQIWPFYGYAPGNYQNTCSICKKEVIVHKLCFVCLECAIAKSRSATHPSPKPVAAQRVE